MAKCLECRFHSKEKRRDVTPEGVADGEMELVAWEDEPQDFIMCMHKRDRPREVGFVRRTPEAGDTCADFEPGKKLAYVAPAIDSREIGMSLSRATKEIVDSLNPKEREVLDRVMAKPLPLPERFKRKSDALSFAELDRQEAVAMGVISEEKPALTPAMFKTFSAEPVLEDDENDDG